MLISNFYLVNIHRKLLTTCYCPVCPINNCAEHPILPDTVQYFALKSKYNPIMAANILTKANILVFIKSYDLVFLEAVL